MRVLIRQLAVLSLMVLAAGIVLAQDSPPTVADLPEGEWSTFTPEGAMCARGTPYSFFVRPADPAKLMVYFQGGGACWNGFSCQPGGPFDDSVGTVEEEIGSYHGIFNASNPANPIADYSIVFVPYCTADVHTGEAQRDFTVFGSTVPIQFNGVANARTALNWAYTNYQSPESVLVTGSSAGAYGAIYHAASVFTQYPDADHVVLGDAGVGVSTGSFDGFDVWNLAANLPADEAFSGAQGTSLTNGLYTGVSELFPDARLAQYTTYADDVQVLFYRFMSGSPADWTTGMVSQLEALNLLPNFRSFIGWGNSHTILASPLFYQMQVDGVSFRDWFAELVNGELPETVACTDCESEELAG